MVEQGPIQYQPKPTSVNKNNSKKRLGYNHPGYDHLHVVLTLFTVPRSQRQFGSVYSCRLRSALTACHKLVFSYRLSRGSQS